MPKATINVSETTRHDLTTLEGAFVELRRLSYGQKLTRRSMSSNLDLKAGKGKDFAGTMQLINEAATLFDFQHCIVDHNLEDENGTKLNLKTKQDITRLDPRVGEEIDTLISKQNNFEEDDEGNS